MEPGKEAQEPNGSTDGIGCEPDHTQGWNSVATNRHGIVRKNLSLAAFPPSACRPALRKDGCALTRSFRFRIPQPPAPRGRTGSGLYARQGGPTRVGPFLFVSGCFRPRQTFPATAAQTLSPHPEGRALRAASRRMRGHAASAGPYMVRDARKGALLTMRVESRVRRSREIRISAARCTPRRASGPASRGCRPGHRPPRRRRRRA
ncbi:hypothetical protein AB7M17_001905 [Bradyrhizobium sp. USDA 377]